MNRALLVCAVLLALPLACRAQPTETVIRMSVQPAPAPKPALKYQLLPELREMNPGNPIQAYSKCFAEQYNFWRNKEAVQNREQWQTMPLRELPLAKVSRLYNRRGPLRYADYAARLDTPDWQILLQMKSEGATLLLPDLQGRRELAGALKVRFRVEIAERRFDDALFTAKTMLALSRHLGEHPTLIGNLVGTAVASLTLMTLEEMIQQPECPNLFWAFTDLPKPFIDLRKGIQGDRVWNTSEWEGLDDRERMIEAQVGKIVDRIRAHIKGAEQDPTVPKVDVGIWLDRRATNETHLRAARKRLLDSGLSAEHIDKFSPLQIILLDEKLNFEVKRDEAAKVMSLPFWQAEGALTASTAAGEDGESLFGWMAIKARRMKLAQARIEQRIGLLRCVEALRMYAAERDGQLPARLEDMHLPLPVDPFTGKPFVYKLAGDTATVRGTPPRGEEKNPAYNIRYEVTIAK